MLVYMCPGRYSARKLLDDGYSILLVPGGATEALYAKPKCNAVYLKKRLGFVKLAMQTGRVLLHWHFVGAASPTHIKHLLWFCTH